MFGLIDANSFYVSCERVFDPALSRFGKISGPGRVGDSTTGTLTPSACINSASAAVIR